MPNIPDWKVRRREERPREKGTAGGTGTLSEKVSSVRVMISALECTVRTTRTVSDTKKRWIGRRPRRGAPRSMARTDGDDSDGEGRERGKNSKKRWGGVRCANSEVDDLVFAGPLWADRYDAFIVSTSGPPQCLRECSPVRIMA